MDIDHIPKDILILVVDDSTAIQAMMTKVLKELGFMDITLADDGEEAVNLVSRRKKSGNPFELIISDIRMPNMDGLQFLKLVRGSMADEKVRFLMVSAENDSNIVLDAIANGVDQYIIKPFDAKKLSEKLLKIYPK